MSGNGSFQIFKTSEGQVMRSDVWESNEPNNGGKNPDYFNQSDETASVMRDGKVYDMWETCISPIGYKFNCTVVCQTSSPTGSVLFNERIPSIHFSLRISRNGPNSIIACLCRVLGAPVECQRYR